MILAANAPWWAILLCLVAAVVLPTLIGLERQVNNKSAGMRTHALVGLGAALFVVVSKYGFSDVLETNLVRLDPSRVAAQIVTGIGFIGAGLVFVRRNKVRGLTTASSIWLTAAVGAAAGAGLVLYAAFTTAAYFLIVLAYSKVLERGRLFGRRYHVLQVQYVDGTGALREILQACTQQGFQILGFNTRSVPEGGESTVGRLLNTEALPESVRLVEVELEIEGLGEKGGLLSELARLPTIAAVTFDDEIE
ncbi:MULTISPECIES: MgtC/SapB family protein [unclassified Arthrobacter]|uniref:MgtC/SapB family protein n=1 Tax=unclassified Arthrobacter TaxID=235627 RepID=UPI00159D0A8E|nr:MULTISPECIES: MgtC/SapB family protein [unclassified Arthrobacter]MCQ9165147.1 MgtC/SapB family protein [Arthrobacter sp. STN4]NVM99759.1 MgtC/SapB family protein [Arthrobacter sp. SDTb3-6]